MEFLVDQFLKQVIHDYGVRFREEFQPCLVAVEHILSRHVLDFIGEASVLLF